MSVLAKERNNVDLPMFMEPTTIAATPLRTEAMAGMTRSCNDGFMPGTRPRAIKDGMYLCDTLPVYLMDTYWCCDCYTCPLSIECVLCSSFLLLSLLQE